MYRRLAIFVFAIVFNESAFADFVEIVARAKPAVVELDVKTKDGFQSGTGFFVSSFGLLITNAHVIAGALSKGDIVAATNDGHHYFVEEILYVDEDVDIAVLQIDCAGVAFLEPNFDDVAEGQTVLVIGNPEGLQGTVSNGLVAAIRNDPRMIQITAPISRGSSGSPVLNDSGQVIGIAAKIYKEGQNLNFAIPVKEALAGFIGKYAKHSAPSASKTNVKSFTLQQEAERELNTAYQELRSTFDPKYKEILREQELVWLKQRDRFKDDPGKFLQDTLERAHQLHAGWLMMNKP